MKPTKKQQELLEFIDGFIRENNYSPSYREIMAALGYKTVSVVARHVDGLVTKGYLKKAEGSARTLEVVAVKEAGKGLVELFEVKMRELLAEDKKEEAETLRRAAELLGVDLRGEK